MRKLYLFLVMWCFVGHFLFADDAIKNQYGLTFDFDNPSTTIAGATFHCKAYSNGGKSAVNIFVLTEDNKVTPVSIDDIEVDRQKDFELSFQKLDNDEYHLIIKDMVFEPITNEKTQIKKRMQWAFKLPEAIQKCPVICIKNIMTKQMSFWVKSPFKNADYFYDTFPSMPVVFFEIFAKGAYLSKNQDGKGLSSKNRNIKTQVLSNEFTIPLTSILPSPEQNPADSVSRFASINSEIPISTLSQIALTENKCMKCVILPPYSMQYTGNNVNKKLLIWFDNAMLPWVMKENRVIYEIGKDKTKYLKIKKELFLPSISINGQYIDMDYYQGKEKLPGIGFSRASQLNINPEAIFWIPESDFDIKL